MKKNKFLIVAIICLILLTICTVTFATDLINPEDFHPEPSTNSSGSTMNLVKKIIGIINVIGVIVLVSTIALLGIKYVSGSLEERAEYKKSMIPIIIGAFLLFSTSTIINLVYSMFYEEGNEYTYSPITRNQDGKEVIDLGNITPQNRTPIDMTVVGEAINETSSLQVKESNGMKYVFKLPEGARTNMPVIIYLHGQGEIGSVDGVKNQAITKYFNNGNVDNIEKCIFVAPVLNSGNWESNESKINSIINEVVQNYGADKNRIMITGFSLGSYGIWNIVNNNPGKFAAVLAVDGAEQSDVNLDYSNWTTPVYAVAGTNWDSNNSWNYYSNMNSILTKIPSNVFKKIDPNNATSHGGVASSVYNNPTYYQWLLLNH